MHMETGYWMFHVWSSIVLFMHRKLLIPSSQLRALLGLSLPGGSGSTQTRDRAAV